MATDLRAEGLIYRNLFPVDGELVEYYNRSLEKVTGKRTALTQFSIDCRGKSPEIVKELGPSYLETTPSNRYMIVISPEQASCDLVDAEFTFDEDAINELHTRHQSGISIVTRVDGLYGELGDGIRAYESIDDLLGIRSVEIRLQTPSGFITMARELRHRLEQLEGDPKLLIQADGAHVNRMIELVKQVGDIRGYPITDISVSHEVGSFASSLYGGVYSFRLGMSKPVRLKRPDRDRNGRFSGQQSPERRTVIYDNSSSGPGAEDHTTYIPLNDQDGVASFLIDHRLATIEPAMIKIRLRLAEDLALIDCGKDPAKMGREERQRALPVAPISEMRTELMHLIAAERNGRLKDALPDVSPGTIIALLRPHEVGEEITHVTEHLLTRLQPYDYAQSARVSPSDLERGFSSSSSLIQEYIISTLRAAQAAEGR